MSSCWNFLDIDFLRFSVICVNTFFYTSCVAIFEFTVTVRTIIVEASSVLRNVTFTV